MILHADVPFLDHTTLKHDLLCMALCLALFLSPLRDLPHPMRCLSLAGVPQARRLSLHPDTGILYTDHPPARHPTHSVSPPMAWKTRRACRARATSMRRATTAAMRSIAFLASLGPHHLRVHWAVPSHTRTTRATIQIERRSRLARATTARASLAGARGGQPSGSQWQQGPQAQHAEGVGSQDAFIAGMIYALSWRLLPGAPYTAGLSGSTEALRSEGGRWKLDECLRGVPRSSTGLFPPWWLNKLADAC